LQKKVLTAKKQEEGES